MNPDQIGVDNRGMNSNRTAADQIIVFVLCRCLVNRFVENNVDLRDTQGIRTTSGGKSDALVVVSV